VKLTDEKRGEPNTMMPMFIFATGIENSYPTIDQGRVRVDEMESGEKRLRRILTSG
jgi:hypothetical protein